MTESLRRFVDWVAAYTLAPPGAVLRMAMSAPAALEPPPPPRPAGSSPPGSIRAGRAADAGAAARAGRCWPGRGAGRHRPGRAPPASRPAWCAAWPMPGCWCPALLPRGAAFAAPDPEHPGPTLAPRPGGGGRGAARPASRRGDFGVTLLTGVTGSGKTEVYLDAVAECLRAGPAGAGAAAGDRAVRAMAGPLPRAASAWPRRSGIPNCRRAPAATPGARWRRARRRSWSARAPRCSCPSPTSA